MAEWEINNNGQYVIEGKNYDRATKVIHAILPHFELEEWRRRVGEEEADRISQQTAFEGELIHLITLYADFKMWKEIDKLLNSYSWLQPHMLAWMAWVEEMRVKWICREKVYHNRKDRIAGRIDGVGYIADNKYPTIVDIKSGSLHDSIGIQVWGAYRELYNMQVIKSVRAKYALVVQLPRSAPGELHTRDYTKERYIEKWEEIKRQYISLYR